MSWFKELGLPFNPFDRPVMAAAALYPSRDLQRLQDAITECVSQRQMLIAIGPAGAGKTTTVFDLLRQEDPNLLIIRDVTLQIESLGIAGIQEALISEVTKRTGCPEPIKQSGHARQEQLRRILGQFARDHEVVLVLEDGHKIPTQTLINLKRLRELRFAMQERLLSIVILAQTAMRGRLKEIREVDLRSQTIEMQGLEQEEVLDYIEHRLSETGKKAKDLFSTEALELIRTGLHWPLEINKACEKMLRDTVTIGEAKVSEDLARKYCNPETQITALWVASGLTITEVWHELQRKGQKNLARVTVQRVLQGLPVNDIRLPALVREVLMPLAGDMAVLYDPTMPGITAEQKRMLEEAHLLIHDIGENLQFGKLAQRSELSQRRIHELLEGRRVTTDDLMHLIGVLKKQKKAA